MGDARVRLTAEDAVASLGDHGRRELDGALLKGAPEAGTMEGFD